LNVPPEGAVTGHLDERLAAICCRHPVVGLAVGVVRDGRLSSFHGLGLADIASGTPVTQDTVFRIGSITKTFTAIAVLQLCEQGLVDLDAPAGEYLRAYRLIPAKPGHRPPTVRQLLTHTAGLPQQDTQGPYSHTYPAVCFWASCSARCSIVSSIFRSIIREPGSMIG